MAQPRKKSMSLIYNGTEAWKDISPYLEKFSYEDSVDESDSVSLALSDRDLKWSRTWTPVKGDVIIPSIILENWNYENEKRTIACGTYLVDDFSFSCPPMLCSINGVSAPVNTDFKETENTKTWEAATVRLIAAEIAGRYGLKLAYESGADIQIAKMEQSNQTDSDFLKKLCEKYGLGIKIYANQIVIWNFKDYYAKEPILTIVPEMTSKWSYNSTMQGTYTGAKVSYTSPNTKDTVEVMVGVEGRLYKTTQKADSEADARIIGESAIRNANRKESAMKLSLTPGAFIYATATVLLNGFGTMDGKYFVEKVSHSVSKKAYSLQVSLSRILEIN